MKPAYGEPIDRKSLETTINFFEQVVILLHPYMPFITEEIWQLLKDRKEGETVCYAQWPDSGKADAVLLKDFDQAAAIVNGVRNIRASKNIPKKDNLELIAPSKEAVPGSFRELIVKLANLSEIRFETEKSEAGFSFLAGTHEMFIPAGEAIDLDEEIEKLQKDLQYQEGFRQSVEKKLSNEGFVNNAPEAVVQAERKKLEDARAKIKALEERLAALK